MGYRSEVKSLVYGEPKEVDAFLNENEELIANLKNDFRGGLTIIENPKHKLIYLSLSYVKWYDSYEDVKRWNSLLSLAIEADLKTEFVRIGEDSEGDIESDYSDDCAFYLQTECRIVANFY